MMKRRGQSMIEVSFLMPWLFFLFIGTLDWGLYAYALIAVQNAARAGAVYTSSSSSLASSSSGACTYAKAELSNLPNYDDSSTCSDATLTVTATSITGVDGAPASKVTVSYRTVVLMPIPGALAGQFTINQTVQMRVLN